MKCIVNGLATEYRMTGKGPAVVLLHGWADKSDTFELLIDRLKQKYTVIAPDLPGFGGSELPREPYELSDFANFVAEFLQKIGVKSVYAFIGHSNGGAICIKGLSMGILSSDKVVLLASSGIRGEYRTSKKLVRIAVKTAKVPTKLLPKRTQKKLRSAVYKTIGSDMLVAENMQETFKLIVSEDLTTEAAMIPQPCLLIYGSEDSATPLRYGEILAKQIEQARLVRIEGADHFLHHTHSSEVEGLITKFLDSK